MQSNQALLSATAQQGLRLDLYQTVQSSKIAGLGPTPPLPHTFNKSIKTHIHMNNKTLENNPISKSNKGDLV